MVCGDLAVAILSFPFGLKPHFNYVFNSIQNGLANFVSFRFKQFKTLLPILFFLFLLIFAFCVFFLLLNGTKTELINSCSVFEVNK